MDGLRFVIYDKSDVYERTLSGLEATADLAPNGISTASFTLDDDHDALPVVTADGARCGVWFRGVERFRGRVRETPGEGPGGTLTVHVESDLRKLWDWQGWPVPSAPVTAQTSEYRIYTGPAETVVKNALAENFTRLGVPWTVAPTLGRGESTRVEFRMHPLADKLVPVLDANGLILTLKYTGTGVLVDVREAATVPGVLSLATGVPDSYVFNRTAPTMTRVVVGGRGEGVAREFITSVDTDREAAWGDIIEGFVDARNTDEGADLMLEAAQALAEGAPRASIGTELMESDLLRYGVTYVEGDRIHVRLGQVDTVQPITAVQVTENPDDGVTVVPRIGDLDVDADVEVRLARDIARLAQGLRDQRRR